MDRELPVRPVDLRVVQVRPVHPGLEVVRDQPRRDPAEELQREHRRLAPRVLVQPDHRTDEHVPRARQHHHECPDRHPPAAGHRAPPAELAVVDLRLGPRRDRWPRHPHPRAGDLLRQVRGHPAAEGRHRGVQALLPDQPLMDRRLRRPGLELLGDVVTVRLDRRPRVLPQPRIDDLREPALGQLPPLQPGHRRPTLRDLPGHQPSLHRRRQVLTDGLAVDPQAGRDLHLGPARPPVLIQLDQIDHVEGPPCHRGSPLIHPG